MIGVSKMKVRLGKSSQIFLQYNVMCAIEIKWNEMKWNIFFLIKSTKISGNTWKQNTSKETYKLPNIHDKKYKESITVKKCLGWINLLVVSRGKCNNDIRENSGSLSIIKRAYLI